MYEILALSICHNFGCFSDLLHGGLQPEEGAQVQLLQEADRAEGGAEDGAEAEGARQRLPPPMLSVRGNLTEDRDYIGYSDIG